MKRTESRLKKAGRLHNTRCIDVFADVRIKIEKEASHKGSGYRARIGERGRKFEHCTAKEIHEEESCVTLVQPRNRKMGVKKKEMAKIVQKA